MRYLAAILIACLAVAAEIIDRIAVTVDNRVITESEIMRQIRITAFLNGKQPVFSAADKALNGGSPGGADSDTPGIGEYEVRSFRRKCDYKV